MKTKTFKKRLISVIAAAAMLAGTLPTFAATSTGAISITTVPGNFNDGVAGGYDEMYGFTPAGSSYLIMQMSGAQIEAAKKPYVEYALNIEEAGDYTLEFKSSPLDNPPYTSPATVSLNGQEISDIAQIKSIDDNTKVYSKNLTLSEGENRIRFTITGARGNVATEGLFHLYYLKATPLKDGTVVQNGKLIVDASTMVSGTHQLTQKTSDPSGNSLSGLFNQDIHSTGAIYSDSISLEYSVTAPAAGTYSMVFHGSSQEEYWGGCKIVLGGTEYNGVNFSGTDVYLSGTGHCRVRNAHEVTLQKGKNTFYLRSNVAGTKNNNYGFSFDRIEFTPVSVSSGETGGSLKFDNNAGSTAGESYYGGTAHQMFDGTSETFNLDIPAGTYNLYVGACCSVFTDYLGSLGIKIGDGDFMDFASENVTESETVYGTIGGTFKYKTELVLNGDETLEFKTTAAAAEGTNTYTLFDFFELVPTGAEIDSVKINETNISVKCGETAQITPTAYYANGYIATDRLVKSVKYVSSDTKVATVNASGSVTAVNPGSATITVTYNDTYSASADVTVLDESGIVPIGFNYDSATKTATVKLSILSDTAASAFVILGGGTTVNGVNTSFTDMDSVSVTPVRGRITTVSKQIDGDYVKAFIWNSHAGMRPVTDSVKVK